MKSRTMGHRFLRAIAPITFSVVFIYASTAWAMLGCLRLGFTTTLEVSAAEEQSDLADSHAQELHCLDISYYLGPFAGNSDVSRLSAFKDAARPTIGQALTVRNGEELPSLESSLEEAPAFSFLIDSPRYLSLSVLRI